MSLKTEFKDREYRKAYAESFANTIIATQIRLLRSTMSQADFARLVGVHQSRVSAMEDENYSAWSTKTLKKLAASKDVVFLGRFVSFGELLKWSREFSEETLSVLPYEDDPAVLPDGDTPSSLDNTGSVASNVLMFARTEAHATTNRTGTNTDSADSFSASAENVNSAMEDSDDCGSTYQLEAAHG